LGNLRGRDHAQDLDIDERIILIRMGVREVGWEGVDWMYLTQDRDQWQTVVSTVMNLHVH
jgi:hypothetical protein